MKKRITKVFSLALAILMLISVSSVSAFAYTSEYITIDCPENFDEEDYSQDDGFYTDVYYSEYALNENNEEYYTGTSVNIYAEACWDDTVESYYDEATLEMLVELNEEFGEIKSQNMYYTTIGGYDAVAYDVYYTYKGADESGKRVVEDWLFSEVIIVKDRTCITIDLDICNADDLLLCRNELTEQFLKGISINTEKVAEAEKSEKTTLLIVLIVLVGIIVVVIVAIFKSSKKKNQPVYPYNNTGVPPQYYNPYGQMPYGQMPYGNQQRNAPAQTTPSYVEPPVAEENNENNPENLDN